jgi:glycosyltransferase involved in cell wall biosynthesis
MIRTSPPLPAPMVPAQALAGVKFALITPARDEAAFIGATIRAVIAQTLRPQRWIIVSDGSTDGTDEIVQGFVREHDWIELLRLPERRERQFAAKAHAFNAGHARLAGADHDYIGNLDADITFEPDYFAFLLARLEAEPNLGVAGTPFLDHHTEPGRHGYAHALAHREHVSGACQIFRRACFESVGGYVPVPGGAIDWIAVTTARMKGWQTRTFIEKTCLHHRALGTGNHRPWFVPFHYGRKACYVGGHPLWALLRGGYQMRQRPWIVGGLMFQLGFFWAMATRTPRVVSAELMAFHRAEQWRRLRATLPFLRATRPPARPLALTSRPRPDLPASAASPLPHITVCICTYQRPVLLRRLLDGLRQQETARRFTFSIVVCDNDANQSARPVVDAAAARAKPATVYCAEARRNIALTRNRALEHAGGEYIAFIDDDEFPDADWLRQMLTACEGSGVTGVLGPVRPYFDSTPPPWIVAGRFCERPEHQTGTVMHWSKSRTGNLLFRRSLLQGIREPFRAEFGTGGEDVDFFRRMHLRGAQFIWCNEAITHELVPPARLTRKYLWHRALLRGRNNLKLGHARATGLLKSAIAVPVYSLVLPAALFLGQHVFMKYSIRFCDHLGRLLALLGINPVRERAS